MSWKVTNEFIEASRSKHGARTVGVIIAEIAHHDGVAWLRQAPSKRKGAGDRARPDKKNIAFRTKLSDRQVRRCIDALQDLDELEVVWGREGRERFQIFRLIVGEIREDEDGVDYERRLPQLEVARCFWTPEQLRLPLEERPMEGHVTPPKLAGKSVHGVDKMSTRHSVVASLDERTSAPERVDICDRDERTSAPAPSFNGARATSLMHGPDHVQTEASPKTGDASVPGEPGEHENDSTDRYAIELALSAAIGRHGQPLTRGEYGAWADVVSQLVDVGASRREVEQRCAAFRAKWPAMVLTPYALVRHWATLGGTVAADRAQIEQRAEILVRSSDGSTGWLLGNERLHRWIEKWGAQMPAEEAEVVLRDSWQLDGEELAAAIEHRAKIIDQHEGDAERRVA